MGPPLSLFLLALGVSDAAVHVFASVLKEVVVAGVGAALS